MGSLVLVVHAHSGFAYVCDDSLGSFKEERLRGVSGISDIVLHLKCRQGA
jgi:hypothetical protein